MTTASPAGHRLFDGPITCADDAAPAATNDLVERNVLARQADALFAELAPSEAIELVLRARHPIQCMPSSATSYTAWFAGAEAARRRLIECEKANLVDVLLAPAYTTTGIEAPGTATRAVVNALRAEFIALVLAAGSLEVVS